MFLALQDRRLWAPSDDSGAAPPDPAPAAAPPADFSWIPETYVKDGQPDLAAFKGHYSDLLADHTRRSEAPAAPESYDFKLADDFSLGDMQLPEGYKARNLADDPDFGPIFDEVGAFLKEQGLPQSAATGLAALMARSQATTQSALYKAALAEYATLGPTPAARDARRDKVAAAIKSRVSADDAKAIMHTTTTAAGLKALERLMSQNLGPAAAVPQHKNQSLNGKHGSELLRAHFTTRA